MFPEKGRTLPRILLAVAIGRAAVRKAFESDNPLPPPDPKSVRRRVDIVAIARAPFRWLQCASKAGDLVAHSQVVNGLCVRSFYDLR